MNDATAFAQDAWWKGSRENVTQSVAMPLQPDERNFQNNEIMAQEIRGTAKGFAPLSAPKTRKTVERNETTVGHQSWQPDIYFSDGSGGVHSQDPRLRRVGRVIACLKQDAELKEACHGSVPGRKTVP